MTLRELNQLSSAKAIEAFMQCCTASSWVEKMVASRPFTDVALMRVAAYLIWQGWADCDYLEAFEGHPKIGDVNSLRAKYANTKALASGEQSSVNEASEQVLNDLSQGNDDYFDKFGFIFIVCATGKSAAQMLALLQARLPNDRATELVNAAEEQRKIFHIRLEKLL
ncbi:MAG: 2-oxo-4-hydroxy-4-carboxy-5-ureidoimidazoline decarboxylase [Psychrosphaera sp.]|nr:2-oxo-4-hydroxy-4-carboxy-5-ureidoimidazoline decarboxylase [Psychrosphaera sp.]